MYVYVYFKRLFTIKNYIHFYLTCMSVLYVYVCVYVYMHVVCMHACIYVCVYICVSMHACLLQV